MKNITNKKKMYTHALKKILEDKEDLYNLMARMSTTTPQNLYQLNKVLPRKISR
jgi:hypothetical protein